METSFLSATFPSVDDVLGLPYDSSYADEMVGNVSLRSISMQSILPKSEDADWIKLLSLEAGVESDKLPLGFARAVIVAAQQSVREPLAIVSSTPQAVDQQADPADHAEHQVDQAAVDLPALLQETTTEELIVRLLGDESPDLPDLQDEPRRRAVSSLDSMDEDYDSDDDGKRKNKRKMKELEPIEELEAQLRNPHLSSKERRQLRNKISARNFRERRKEYISVLEGQVRDAREGESQAKEALRKAEMENRRLRQVVDILKTAVISRSTDKTLPPPATKQEILKKTGGNAGAFDPFGRGMPQVGVHTCLLPSAPVIDSRGQVIDSRASDEELAGLAMVVAAAQSINKDGWDTADWALDGDETSDLIERFNLSPWLNPKTLM